MNTIGHFGKSIHFDIGTIPLGKYSPFSLNIRPDKNNNNIFSSAVISNNTKDKRVEVSITGIKTSLKSPFDLNLYISDDSIGFYFNDNSELCYNAAVKKFRTKWNRSIYGRIFKIPYFVPDNLSYSKISSLFSGKNIATALAAMTFGNTESNMKELIYNVRISKPKAYITPNAQYTKVTLSTSYVENLIKSLSKSSESAYVNFLNPYITKLSEFLASSSNKTIEINFVIKDNMIISAETSFVTQKGVLNISLNISGSNAAFSVRNISDVQSDKTGFVFKLLSNHQNGTKAIFSHNRNLIASLILKQETPSAYTFDVSYIDKNSRSKFYSILIDGKLKKTEFSQKHRNIFSLSVAELIELASMITE